MLGVEETNEHGTNNTRTTGDFDEKNGSKIGSERRMMPGQFLLTNSGNPTLLLFTEVHVRSYSRNLEHRRSVTLRHVPLKR